MSRSRLSVAVAEGLLPTGGHLLAVGVSDPRDLDALQPAAIRAVQPRQPDHDRLIAAGLDAAPDFPENVARFDAALVVVPRSRQRARSWIAQSAQRLVPDGLLVVDGARKDGIDSHFRAIRTRIVGTDSLTKAHGRLFWGRIGADRFTDWRADAGRAGAFVTAAGAFSADHVDPGSARLAAALPDRLAGRVVDLGAGWGYLSAAVLSRPGVASVALVEADHPALVAARHNIRDPRARFHWADATSWMPSDRADVVVMNPPFHVGRAAEPGLGQAFIAQAARMLAPRGELWLVANRNLPYEPELDAGFEDWELASEDASYKVLHAARPRRRARISRP